LGAIELTEADSVILEDNFVAGAQLIGINYRGSLCDTNTPLAPGYNHSIKRNTVYGALSGVVILPMPPIIATPRLWLAGCIRISEFTIFKSTYWGIYYQGYGSVIIDSNILVDNQVNIFTFIYLPNSLDHEVGNKKAIISNSIIVGQSLSFDCVNDLNIDSYLKPKPKFDLQFPMASFGSGINYDSKIGIVWSNFLANEYDKPYKPWPGIHSYPQINGIMQVDNITFAHFDLNCLGSYDSLIASSLHNDDAQHPINIKNSKLYFVHNSSKIWIHRPNLAKIDPTCCVDMDCDGLKKNLLTDLDGSFLGSPAGGTVTSQSEFGWGSQQRGLGDFRIPSYMLSYPNGTFMSPSLLYKYPGIVRDENLCTYRTEWQAYECHGLKYKMLIIESMDNDTETRRLSPVAVLSDNGYLDLINGPQDNHWCAGYACSMFFYNFFFLISPPFYSLSTLSSSYCFIF
jgi:hypothetical protein